MDLYSAENLSAAFSSPVLCSGNSNCLDQLPSAFYPHLRESTGLCLGSLSLWSGNSQCNKLRESQDSYCLFSLSDHFLSLPDIPCLENHYFRYLVLLLLFQMGGGVQSYYSIIFGSKCPEHSLKIISNGKIFGISEFHKAFNSWTLTDKI